MAVHTAPPGPRLNPLAAARAARRDPLAFMDGLVAYGDVVHVRTGPIDLYVLRHPEAVKDVLVTHQRRFDKGRALQEVRRLLDDGLLTSEGELHRRQRRLIQPLLAHERVLGYADAMVAHARSTAAGWAAGARAPVDVHRAMSRLTLRVVVDTLFRADVDDATAQRIAAAQRVTQASFGRLFSPFPRLRAALPLPSTRRFDRARATLDEIVLGLIGARRRAGDGAGDDLLGLLLAARHDDGSRMGDAQVRDEALTLLLAGHETTASALAWAWHLLSHHPVEEAALHEEVDRVLAGRPATAADLPALTHTRAVLAESLRLYPPAWVLGRRALEDHPVDGYVVPAGAIVSLSPYLVHRDPRFWPQPTAFRPARWSSGQSPAPHRYAYLPFGGGRRVCVGEHFAWMEGTLVLATIAQRWRLRAAPGVQVRPQAQVTLRPRDGLPMIVEQRAHR